MKTIKNFIFTIAFFLFSTAIITANATTTFTNNTGYTCSFIDGTKDPITVAAGATLNYTFTSTPISYSFGPNATKTTTTFTDGTIYYNPSSNYLYVSSTSSGTTYTNSTNFQTYLKQNTGAITVLNKNSSISITNLVEIGVQFYSSGSLSSAPIKASFSLNNTTGQVVQTLDGLLTNNSSMLSTNVTYHGSSIITGADIPAGATAQIPNDSTYMLCINSSVQTPPNYFMTVPVTSSVSSNMFGSGSILNTTTSTLYCVYYGHINNDPNYTLAYSCLLAGLGQIPLITGTTKIEIYASRDTNYTVSNLLYTVTTDANTTWYINPSSMNTVPLYTNVVELTNQTGFSSQIVETIDNSTVTTTLAVNQTINYAFNSASPTFTFGPNAQGIFNSDRATNLYSYNVIYDDINNNLELLYLGGTDPVFLNDTDFQLYVTATDNNGQGTRYSFVLDKNQTISSTGIIINDVIVQPYSAGFPEELPSQAVFNLDAITGAVIITDLYTQTILNNFNKATSQITFYNGTTGISSYLDSLNNWDTSAIPTGTTLIKCTGLANNGTFDIAPTTTNLNIYGSGLITNSTTTNNILIKGQDYINYVWIERGSYTINANESIPSITGVTHLHFYLSNGTFIIDLGGVNSSSSYKIVTTSGGTGYGITVYTPDIVNNSSQTITSLDFYNSNNQITNTLTSLAPSATYPTPTTTSFLTYNFISNSATSNIIMPVSYPELLNLFTDQTITNNSEQNVQINYYGNYNLATNSLLTNPAISVANHQVTPIPTGALNIQVLDADGNQVIPSPDLGISTALTAGNSYYIIYDSGIWTLITHDPSGFYITNNSTQDTGHIIFKNSSGTPIGETESIIAGGSYEIPTNTRIIECTGLVYDISCKIQTTGTENINIYTDYILTNDTDYELIATYYGLEGVSTVTNGTITIPVRTSTTIPSFVPIITSTTEISVTQDATTVIPQQPIDASSYIITFDGISTWSMTEYVPTLHNNSSQNGTNLTFFNANGGVIPQSHTTIASNGNVPVPVNAVSVAIHFEGYTSTVTVPTSMAEDSYIFSSNTMTNLADQTIEITFYGDANSLGQTAALNTPIAIQAGQNLPQIIGGTSVSVTAGATSVIPQESILDATSYFINHNPAASPQWWLSLTAPLSTALFVNNYNQALTDLKFFNSSGLQLGTTINNFDAWESTSIPEDTLGIFFYYNDDYLVNMAQDPTNLQSVNAFTGYVVHNNTDNSDLAIWFNSTDLVINPGIITPSNTSTPIITNTNQIMVSNTTYSNNAPTVTYIPYTTINPYSSYYIIYNGTNYELVQSLPTTPITFTNNFNGTATNFNFYNTNNTIIGTTNQTIAPYNAIDITSSAVYAKCTYTSTEFDPDRSQNLTIPVSDTTSSALFTNNYVINQMTGPEQAIYILYYGTVNGHINQPLSQLKIANNNYNDMTPIISGTTMFEIYDSTGTLQATQNPLESNTNYTISGSWNITPSTPYQLTNNSGQDTTNLIFYDNTTPIGDPIPNFYNQTAVTIPTDATVATTDEIFNTITSTISIPVSNSENSNLVTNYSINNNSDQTVTIIFYGTLNEIADQDLNDPALSMASFTATPILTGAQTVSVFFDSVQVISNATIEPQTTYYINYINSSWSFDNYASIVTLTNNIPSNASNLIFYDANDLVITTDSNFDAYQSQPTPAHATFAAADFTSPYNSTLNIPVTGAVNSNFFTTTNATITNNTSDPIETIGIIFYGTLNGQADLAFNNPTIEMTHNLALSIMSGAESFTIFDTNDFAQIVNYPINQNESYVITNTNGIWQVNVASYTTTLQNNYNQDATNLKFFSDYEGTEQLGSTQTIFLAFSSAGIPTNSVLATMEAFNSTLTLPISTTSSSYVYASIFYNKTEDPLSITYYGTINEIADTPLNSPAISCAAGATIPFPVATQYAIITSGSNTLDTRDTSYNPLSGSIAYDIIYNPDLNIIPHVITLTNNFYQGASNINFFDATGNFISDITDINPFANITVPTNAYFAEIDYNDYEVTIPLSTTTPTYVLTNNILSNSTTDDLFVFFYDTNNISLNNNPILLPSGTSIPFITGSQYITVIDNDIAIISNYKIIPTESYQIVETNFTNRQIRAEDANLPQATISSSALGIIRCLGGQIPAEPIVPPVEVYGDTQNLFDEFLYIDIYAQIITDPIAQAATAAAVHAIVEKYAADYSNQPDFNYISYLYLMNNQLTAAQILLRNQYPNSIQHINLFFRYIQKRNNNTLLH